MGSRFWSPSDSDNVLVKAPPCPEVYPFLRAKLIGRMRNSPIPDRLDLRAVLLAPLAALYCLGWIAYESMYRFGIKRAKRAHPRVICIGNLVVGGMGKTPFTIELAKILTELGHQVVVSCSGYGAPRSRDATLAPRGSLDAREWGDEAAVVRSYLPELDLVVGRNRVMAAEITHKHAPNSILVLDDGYQHLPLAKNLVILLDAPKPSNPLCLPAGPYRQPRSARSRADLVLPDRFAMVRVSAVDDDFAAEIASGATVQILTSIANPYAFFLELEHFGLKIAFAKAMKDHDPLDSRYIFDGFDSKLPIVVTMKDWVKLRHRTDLEKWQFRVVQETVGIEPREEFIEWLQARIPH